MQKPWINNFQSNGFEGACIACCNRKAVGRCCGCNISIRLSDSLSGYSSAHHQFRVKLRRSEIEGEDTLGKMRKHFSFEPIVKNGLPFPGMAPIPKRSSAIVTAKRKAFQLLVHPTKRSRSDQELTSKAPISHWCQAGSFESHRFCRCLIAILLQSFDVRIEKVSVAPNAR